jgi:protein-L-isoaspartate(D-aspartate) O-methyltransferase
MIDSSFAQQRHRMVEKQLRASGIRDERVLHAFEGVPRERFVRPGVRRKLSYFPVPLPIGHGQTLSQPWIVARMLELAELKGEHKVLDVGSGSGYQTALLARLCHRVYGVEIVPALAERAQALLRELGIENASIHVADGTAGLPEYAPYDAILVAAAATSVPEPLIEQLVVGGRLLIPVGLQESKQRMSLRMLFGRPAAQQLHRFTRRAKGYETEVLEGVNFVPFVGA